MKEFNAYLDAFWRINYDVVRPARSTVSQLIPDASHTCSLRRDVKVRDRTLFVVDEQRTAGLYGGRCVNVQMCISLARTAAIFCPFFFENVIGEECNATAAVGRFGDRRTSTTISIETLGQHQHPVRDIIVFLEVKEGRNG